MNKNMLTKLTIADKMGLFLVIVLGLMALMAYSYFDQELAALQDDLFTQQKQGVAQRLRQTAARAAADGLAAWRADLLAAMAQECDGSGIVTQLRVSLPGEPPLTAGAMRDGEHTESSELAGPGGRTAQLAIFLSADGFRARTAEFRGNLLYGAILVVSLGVFLIATLVIHLLRPLLRLAESVQRIQGGDLGTRCPVDRPDDEVGKLATAFNELMGNLQEKEDTMLSAYDALNGTYMQLESVLESLPAAVVGCDAAQQVTVVNRSFLELFKLERDELLGEPLPELLARAAPQLAQPVAAAAAGTRAGRQLTEINGQPWQLEVFAAADGAAGGRVLLLTPLTDANPREAERRAVLNRVARELHAPLTVVKSTLGTVHAEHLAQLPLDAQICLRMAATQTDQLCRLVNNLIALAESEHVAAGREAVELDGVLDTVLALFRDELERKGLIVRRPDGQPPRLLARRDWLVLALENIIGNAVHHAPEGSDLVIAWQPDGVSISDQGPGMPPAMRERVFTPFAAQTEGAAGEGAGVGLAATRRALELMGWEIELADGAGGHGTRVTLTARG